MGKGFPVVMSDEFQLFCYGLDFPLRCVLAVLSVGQSSVSSFVFEDGRAKIVAGQK